MHFLFTTTHANVTAAQTPWTLVRRTIVPFILILLTFALGACGGGNAGNTGAGRGGAQATASANAPGGAAVSAAASATGSVAGAGAAPGAGASRATASASARNPCDLVTKQEVEEALGTTVHEPRSRANICDFSPAGKPFRAVSYAVRWTGGREAMKVGGGVDRMIGSLGDAAVQAEIKKAQARTAAELEGLGDEASFQLVTLKVRKGDAYISLDARMCSRLQAIAVARKIVDRL